jgi:hypothetical protein
MHNTFRNKSILENIFTKYLYIISSAEFYKVVNRFFWKIELRRVLDTFLEVIQNLLNKFEKFGKIS